MHNNTRKLIPLLSIVIIITLIFFAFNHYIEDVDKNPSGLLSVYFIDTGQSDCILIETPNGQFVLIDSADNGDEDIVLDFLHNKGVSTLEYIIFTHPHADHIGGGFEVIGEIEALNIIMPDVASDSKTYSNLISKISQQEIVVSNPYPGFEFNVDGVSFTVFSPADKDYGSNLNEYSIVCRMDYRNSSFLFTGDAEALNEEEMLEAGFNLDVDVLKVGHHGSSSSSTILFLQAVTPEYAVILCGSGNKYGHPHEDTLSKLNEVSATVYRTDINGDITITTDGKTLDITIEKQSEVSQQAKQKTSGRNLSLVSYYCIYSGRNSLSNVPYILS